MNPTCAPPPTLRERRYGWRNVALWIVLVLFIPFAFLGVAGFANEYESWGSSGVDCDGPDTILVTAWPALIVYGLAALVFIRRVFRRRSWGAGVAALACLLLVAGLVSNIGNANREAGEPWYRESCMGG